MYEKVDTSTPVTPNDFHIKRTNDDGSISMIPADPANSDYQAYLATLAANSATPQA